MTTELFQLPLLTAEEIDVLRHGLRRLVPNIPGTIGTIDSAELVAIAHSLNTALLEAQQR